MALVTAHAEQGVTHARVASLTPAHSRDVTLKLQELIRKGLLVASGPPRTRLYALPGDSGTVRSSEESLAGSEETSEESLTDSKETRGWRAIEAQLDAVLAYCKGEWRTLPEIAKQLDRKPSTVRTMYLRPLLERGTLIHRYPNQPRHPHQAYRSAGGRRR